MVPWGSVAVGGRRARVEQQQEAGAALRWSWATCCVQSCRSYLAWGFHNSPHGLGSAGGVAIGANTQISFAFALVPTAAFRGCLRAEKRNVGGRDVRDRSRSRSRAR